MFGRPMLTLLRSHLAPAFPQCASLRGRQGLEFAERRTNLRALPWREVLERARVFAQLVALRRRHRGPTRKALADLLLVFRRQPGPAQRMLGEAMLAVRAQFIPLCSQRREYTLLPAGKARPSQRRFMRIGTRWCKLRCILHRGRRTCPGDRRA